MKKRKFFVFFLFVFSFFLLFLSVFFFTKGSIKKEDLLSPDRKNFILLEKFSFTNEKEGHIDLRIRAERAKKFFDREEIEIEKIEGEYNPEKGILVSFKGKEGTINVSQGKCRIFEPQILYNNSFNFKTAEIDIDLKRALAKTEKPLTIEGEKLNLRGVGLVGKLKEGLIDIERQITGSLKTEEETYEFSSKRFIYDAKNDTYILEGEARLESKNMKVTCQRLSIQKKDGAVERIEAKGNVRTKMNETILVSGNALYDLKNERILFSQAPEIRKNNIKTKGDVIIYDRKNESFFIKGTNLKIENR